MTLQEEIAEAIKQARFDSINTERDPFYYMAQSAIDVVDRRLLSRDTINKTLMSPYEYGANNMVIEMAWKAVKDMDWSNHDE